MSIVTYRKLFERSVRSWGVDDPGRKSEHLKYPVEGSPTVYLAFVSEDYELAGHASATLAGCGVSLHADWSAGQLFDKFSRKDALTLETKLGYPDAWLVALVSERAKKVERLKWVLDLAKEVLPRRHAYLPVRCEAPEFELPSILLPYPRIEARGDDLVHIQPDSHYHLSLGRWFCGSA